MSFCPKGKKTILNNKGDTWTNDNRQNGKYGKIIKKVLKEQCSDFEYTLKDLEQLVNKLKGEVNGGRFSIIKGKAIAKVYAETNNDVGSCMRGKPKRMV